LPEFAPATLFSDLSLPEVRLVSPTLFEGRTDPYLPVLQALSELAPGKVSRRLDAPLWLGPMEDQLIAMLATREAGVKEEALDVDDWYVLEPQAAFKTMEGGRPTECSGFRPVEMLLVAVPASAAANRVQLLDTSNARIVWRTQIFGRRAGAVFASPSTRVGVARLVQDVAVHTHASQSAATVRRYAVGSKVGLRLRRGQEHIDYSSTWRFTRNGRPCGIGFEIEADALRFRLKLPDSPYSRLRDSEPAVQRAARTARYAWEAQHGQTLAAAEENMFLRGWLAQIFQVASIALAEEGGCTLENAFDRFASGQESTRLAGVLTTIFQSPEAPGTDDGGEAPQGGNSEPRLKQRLRAVLETRPVLQALRDLARQTLTAAIGPDWDPWLNQALMHTLGAGLLDAIQQACPQIDSDDLAVDVDPGCNEDGSSRPDRELWLSEVNPGGNGLIEQVVEVLATDSTLFYRRIESALGPSEFELIDEQLRQFIHWIGTPGDDELVAMTQAIRGAQSSHEAQERLATLRRALIERGQSVFHGYVAALSTRVLRPDTPPAMDLLLAEIMRRWGELEARLGLEVEARVICALFSGDPRIDQAFSEANFELPVANRETWRFSMLLGVLWARGHALRANALPLPLRFGDFPAVTERMLLQEWLSESEAPIHTSGSDWLGKLHERLIRYGRALLSVLPNSEALNAAMAAVVVTPVQLEYLNVYAKLVAVVRGEGEVRIELELEATV
jgi:hypothetical protein